MDQFSESVEAVPGCNSMLLYYPGFNSPWTAECIFRKLLHEIIWEQKYINFWGKTGPVPRLTSWYSIENKSYSYSGIANRPASYCDVLSDLHRSVEAVTKTSFNSVLLNLYRNGDDTMGWHSDDEPTLDGNADIASLSYGVTRDFQVKPKDKSQKLINISLTGGSLLVMKSPFQQNWMHRVPRRKNLKEARINLTFRRLL